MGEEIDRLTSELAKTHAQGAALVRSAQEWQTHAEEAEHRAEAAEHRAEAAERELSRIQCSFPEFENILRAMSQAYANVTGQNQDLNPTGQGEHHARSRRSGSDEDLLVTGDGNNPVFGRPSMHNPHEGSHSSGNSLPHAPNALSCLESHLNYGSSSGSSLSSRPVSFKRSFEPAVGDPEGPSLRRPPPPLTHPRDSFPEQLPFAETIGPGNRSAGPSHVAGWGTDLTNRPEDHANMQEESPALGKASRLATGHSLQMPQNPSQIPGIPTDSTAPPVQKRSTPVPDVRMAPWGFLQGPVVTPRIVTSYFKEYYGEDLADSEGNSKPEAEAMSSVATRKQPERPSPVKEASSATRGDAPKPTGTQ